MAGRTVVTFGLAPGLSSLQTVNRQKDQGGPGRKTVVTVEFGSGPRVSKVSTVTGTWGGVLDGRRSRCSRRVGAQARGAS